MDSTEGFLHYNGWKRERYMVGETAVLKETVRLAAKSI